MTRTAKGYELAKRLESIIPQQAYGEAVEILSKIAKHNATLHHLAERACNDVHYGPQDEQRAERLERVVERHMQHLNDLTNGAICGVHFNGDPRGTYVKLLLKQEHRHLYDCFGGEGVCVP